ncbi:MAG: hypothetical protein KGY99_04180, partial [Phycisphaerae bacterium]|nr:hypothetical protein [Phycisphaerae bacterium]
MHRLRIGSFLSLPMGILLLVLFFFPWVRVSCGVPDANATVATASGWQLTLGRYSEPDYEQEGGAKLANELRVPAGTSVDSRPKFILGLVAALGTLAVAGLGLWGKLPADGAGHLLTLLGVLGVITMILAVFVDFEQEINRGLEQRPGVEASVAAATTRPAGGEAISDDRTRVARAVAELWANKGRKSLVRKETTPYLWLSLVVYMLVGGT